jgi:hypothetical protein
MWKDITKMKNKFNEKIMTTVKRFCVSIR